MARSLLLLALMAQLYSMAFAIEYNCATMLPMDADARPGEDMEPFKIIVGEADHHQTSVDAGEKVTVKISASTDKSFTTFVLKAHRLGSNEVFGHWESPDPHCHVTECRTDNDYVIHNNFDPKMVIVAKWLAPLQALTESVEFVATVANSSKVYWSGIHSTVVDLNGSPDMVDISQSDGDVSPVEDVQEEDFHDEQKEVQLAAEMKQHQQEMIDSEIQYSEGDWQIKQEEERRAREEQFQLELQQYEIQRQREEQERQERIQAEIRDEEEHDALVHLEEESNKDDEDQRNVLDFGNDLLGYPGSGAATFSLSVGLLLSVLAHIFA